MKLLIFLLGGFLFSLNIIGLFTPLKNADIYNEQSTGFKNDTTLSPDKTFFLLKNLNKENNEEYVTEVNNIFNRSIAHYWEDDGRKKYNISIPFYENWILAILQYIYPAIYERYEFCNYKKAIERGVGLCSQQAIAITDYLNKNDVKTQIVGLNGHVVATALVDQEKDVWWLLDPDYGVIMPYDVKTLGTSPNIAENYYKNVSDQNNNNTQKNWIETYQLDKIKIYPDGVSGYTDCNWKKIYIERNSYLLIWIIPLLLMLPFTYSLLKKIKNVHKN